MIKTHFLIRACSFCILGSTLVACSPQKSDSPKQVSETKQASETQTLVQEEQQEINTDTAKQTAEDSKKITVNTPKGAVTLFQNPKPVAVFDMGAMQDLSALGVSVQGVPQKLLLDNLMAKDAPKATEVGTLFEPNIEALHAMKPQAILIGGRMLTKYENLKSIAPTLVVSRDTKNIYVSSKQRLKELGDLFGKTKQAEQLQLNIDDAIARTKQAVQGKGNGIIIMVNGNKISAFGANSRFGFVHSVFGIPMADNNIQEATHGQPVSFEYLQKTNPDWLFVLDRSSAIGQEGIGADKVLDNQLLHQTNAWKNKHIVYLSPDSYLAFGGYYQWIKDAETITNAFNGM